MAWTLECFNFPLSFVPYWPVLLTWLPFHLVKKSPLIIGIVARIKINNEPLVPFSDTELSIHCTYNLRLFRLFRGNSSSLDRSSSATCNVIYTVMVWLRKYREEAEEEAMTKRAIKELKIFVS